MNFYDTRNDYLKLKEEISKIKTQADFNNIKNHIKENLYSLSNNQLQKLVETFNKKGGNLDIKELLVLKEAITDDTDNFDLDTKDEEYVDIDDDENFIDDEEEPNEYKTVIVSNVEPLYTMEDINELEADELGITPEDYLEDCINNIKTYIIDELGESFLLDIPVEYCDNDGDIEDYISDYISDETGYLVDSFEWEYAEDDNDIDESLKENNNIDVYNKNKINKKNKGGIITLSLNVTNDKKYTKDQKLQYTGANYDYKNIISNILNKNGIDGATISNINDGIYKGNNEKSIDIKLVGIDTKTLDKLAQNLASEFKQDEVLVNNLNNNKTYFVTNVGKYYWNFSKFNEAYYNQETGKVEPELFYGVPGVEYISHGEWNSPEVYYKDKAYNYHDLEDSLWELFQEDIETGDVVIDTTGFEDFEDAENEATIFAFEEWVKNNPDLVYSELEYLTPIEESLKESLNKLELKNTDIITWKEFDNYMNNENKIYEYSNYSLDGICSYYGELYNNNEKIANLEYNNFYGMGEWAEFIIYSIIDTELDNKLKNILLKLGFKNDTGDLIYSAYEQIKNNKNIELDKNNTFILNSEEYIPDSTPEEVFNKYIKQIENEYNNEYNNINESLKESTEIDRQLFVSLVKLGDNPYDGYSILNDGNFVTRIYAESDEEAKQKFQDYINKKQVVIESKQLRYNIKTLNESNETDIKKAELQAYKKLKKNKNLYAVIYAYSQGNKKIVLNPVLEKDNQEEVDKFVNAFKKGKQGQQIIVYVYYQSQINKLDKKFNSSKEGENK